MGNYRFIVLLLVFFGISASFAQREDPSLGLSALKVQAMDVLYQKQDIRRAAVLLDQYLDQDSGNAEVWFGRGVCYEALGGAEDAIGCYTAALHHEPTRSEWYAKRAALRENQRVANDWVEAYSIIMDYNFALVYDPQNAELWMRRALCKLTTFTVYLDANELTGSVLNRAAIAQEIPYAMDCCVDFDKAAALNYKVAPKCQQKCTAFEHLFTEAFRVEYHQEVNQAGY